jgi:hypothetical protein
MVTIADALRDAISKYELARAAFDEITAVITERIRAGQQPTTAELRSEDELRARVVIARRSAQTWFAIQTHYAPDEDEIAPTPTPSARRSGRAKAGGRKAA